jgi:hypothetical protein
MNVNAEDTSGFALKSGFIGDLQHHEALAGGHQLHSYKTNLTLPGHHEALAGGHQFRS